MAKSAILYFTELGCIHTQRAISVYRGNRGLHTDINFFLNSLWFFFYRGIIFECEEIWDVRWMLKNQFCTSVSTPVHLKSTKSMHLLKLLIPLLPSRDLLSEKLNSWKGVCLLVQLIDDRSFPASNFSQISAFRVKAIPYRWCKIRVSKNEKGAFSFLETRFSLLSQSKLIGDRIQIRVSFETRFFLICFTYKVNSLRVSETRNPEIRIVPYLQGMA